LVDLPLVDFAKARVSLGSVCRRTLIASENFDECWHFHLIKEHHRVHETRYQYHW